MNDELLGTRTDPDAPNDDRHAIERQVGAMKETMTFVDRQAGGKGHGWRQIAVPRPKQARASWRRPARHRAGRRGGLAGRWRRLEDLRGGRSRTMQTARRLLGVELDWLFGLGIGGYADPPDGQRLRRHRDLHALAGRGERLRHRTGYMKLEDAWDSGIRYRIDRDGDDAWIGAEHMVVSKGSRLSRPPSYEPGRSLLHRCAWNGDLEEDFEHLGADWPRQLPRPHDVWHHAAAGDDGGGMIIDIDHMSPEGSTLRWTWPKRTTTR